LPGSEVVTDTALALLLFMPQAGMREEATGASSRTMRAAAVLCAVRGICREGGLL
jgi:hypothetical protein